MKPRILFLTLFLVLPSCSLATQQNPIPDSNREGSDVLRLVSQSRVPTSGTNGYTYPACIHCPPAKCTREALAHRFQGKMALILVVTPEGRAKDIIKVPKPFPYGLTESAIEAVKKWKFKPATGPDGKPAAVRQVIEFSFDCSRNAAGEPVH